MTKGSIGRCFDFDSIPPETKKKLDELRNLASKSYLTDNKEFDRLIEEQSEILRTEEEKFFREFPPNPPNERCHYALINGALIDQESHKEKTEFQPFFDIGFEKVFIWSHKNNRFASLIIDTDYSQLPPTYWKTFASIVEIVYALSTAFEWVTECNYDWIYNFNQNLTIKENSFLYIENNERLSGTMLDKKFFDRQSPIIELLIRDECFYVMCSNLLASFYNHRFCVHCAFSPEEEKMHPNHEIPIWEVAQAIPRMEVAIVQATRSVEAALGKPGKKDKTNNCVRTISRWKNKINLDPNKKFDLANKSFLEYYYDLFDIRNNAAHSLGQFPYETSRQLTIEAQCFAWLIVIEYLNKHKKNIDQAKKLLSFTE